MLFPLRDHNPRTRFPAVTVALIVVNAIVYLCQWLLDPRTADLLVRTGGAIPYEIANWVDIRPRDLLPLPGSIFTSMFLHGGWMHLIGNMWFLWIFGDNVEERLGRGRFLIFYLLVGAAGALAQVFSLPQSTAPMIGASGAIAGVLGGYVMLYPRARIVSVAIVWLIDVPAWIFLGIWFLGQFLIPTGSGVAWMAHVGGFLAGLGAVRLLARSRPPSPTTADVEYLPPRRRNQSW